MIDLDDTLGIIKEYMQEYNCDENEAITMAIDDLKRAARELEAHQNKLANQED